MEMIYHGSCYLKDKLMPGFERASVLMRWDQFESNKFLYATIDREQAIAQAFVDAVDKRYPLSQIVIGSDEIALKFSDYKLPSKLELSALDVYVYHIPFDREDLENPWIQNLTENGSNHEHKTEQIIRDFEVEKVNLEEWMHSKKLILESRKA